MSTSKLENSFLFNINDAMTLIIVKLKIVICAALCSNSTADLQFLWKGARELVLNDLEQKLSILKTSFALKMDLSVNPLLGSYFNFGQFEAFNPRLSSSRNKEAINRWAKIIIFFNGLKLVIIVVSSWCGFPDMKLYLVEVYFFGDGYQKFLDIGIAVVFINLLWGFSYWISISEKANSLESFKFLLIPDTNDRYRHGHLYRLDKRSTDKFLRTYRIGGQILWMVIITYSIFISATILRCLYHSFYRVGLLYFYTFCLILLLTTCLAYLFAIIFLGSMFVLVIVLTEYLVLRVEEIDKMVWRKFTRIKLVSTSRPVRMRKQTALKILITLNEFCQQFAEINSVLDRSFSPPQLGIFIAIFVFPYFILFVDTITIRLFLSVLVTAVYCLNSSFSFCNDRLRKRVGFL